jgi:hypothetical protein
LSIGQSPVLDANQMPTGKNLYMWGANISHQYTVRHQEYYVTRIWICMDESVSPKLQGTAHVQGKVTFRNPYGFIPARDYGLLPFEVRATDSNVMLHHIVMRCILPYCVVYCCITLRKIISDKCHIMSCAHYVVLHCIIS